MLFEMNVKRRRVDFTESYD